MVPTVQMVRLSTLCKIFQNTSGVPVGEIQQSCHVIVAGHVCPLCASLSTTKEDQVFLFYKKNIKTKHLTFPLQTQFTLTLDS